MAENKILKDTADQIDYIEKSLLGLIEVQKKYTEELKKTESLEADEQLKKTNEQIKEQTKTLGKLTDAQTKLITAQKGEVEVLDSARKATREAKKENELLLRSRQQNGKSLDAMRAKLTLLNKEYTKGNAEARAKTLPMIQKQRAEVLKLEKAIGQNQREVGNYTESMKAAIMETGIMNGVSRELTIIQKLIAALYQKQAAATKSYSAATKSASLATGGMTKALKILKVALISSGIGAIVVALGAVVTYFQRSQAGADKFSQVMAGVSATVDVLLDRLSTLGEGISLIFTGEWKKGADLIKDSFRDITTEIAEEVKLASEFEKIMQRLRREASAFEVTEARIRNEINKARLDAEDQTKAVNERISAERKAFVLEKKIALEKMRILKEGLIIEIQGGENAETRLKAEKLINDVIKGRKQLEIENLGLAQSSIEDLEESNRKIAEIINAESEQYRKQRSLTTKINSLLKEQNNIKETGVKLSKKQVDYGELLSKDRAEVDSFGDKLMQDALNYRAGLDAEKEALDESEANYQDYASSITSLMSSTQSVLGSFIDAFQSTIEIRNQQIGEEMSKLNAMATASSEGLATSMDAQQQKISELQEERDKAVENQARYIQMSQALSAIENGINMTVAISSLFRDGAMKGGIPGVAIAAGAIATMLSLYASFASQAKSNQFADGVIGLEGPGTERSDSIPAMLSKGESVMTAKETNNSRSILESIRAGEMNDSKFMALYALSDIAMHQDKTDRLDVRIKGLDENTGATNRLTRAYKLGNRSYTGTGSTYTVRR